jgi:hypothetical protein
MMSAARRWHFPRWSRRRSTWRERVDPKEPEVDAEGLEELVTEAWIRRAPRALAYELEEGLRSEPDLEGR